MKPMIEDLRHRRLVGAAAVGVGVVVVVIGVASVGDSSSGSGEHVVATTVVTEPASQNSSDVSPNVSVTDIEMEQALTEVVQCVRDGGFDAELAEFNPGLGWHIEIPTGTQDAADRASELLDACTAEQAETMDAYWTENRLSPDQQDQFNTFVRQCLFDHDVELEEGRSLASSVPVGAGKIYTQCQIDAVAAIR